MFSLTRNLVSAKFNDFSVPKFLSLFFFSPCVVCVCVCDHIARIFTLRYWNGS